MRMTLTLLALVAALSMGCDGMPTKAYILCTHDRWPIHHEYNPYAATTSIFGGTEGTPLTVRFVDQQTHQEVELILSRDSGWVCRGRVRL